MKIRLLDRLVFREVLGPWVFGVALFTIVLMASTYLFRLTDLLVKGIEPWIVGELALMYLPGIVVKTFPMSVLLGTLLGMARLSNDSEVVAVLAAGGSLYHVMRPILLFGLAVAFVTFAFGEWVVPSTSLRAAQLQLEISNKLKMESGTNFYQPLYVNGIFRGHVMARNVSLTTETLYGVTGTWFDDKGTPILFFAEEMYYAPTKRWRLKNATMFQDLTGRVVVKTEDTEPPGGASYDFTPKDVLTSKLRDPDALSLHELGRQIERLRKNPRGNKARLRDLEVGYWMKFGIPLSAMVFAMIGAPAAIRRGKQSIGVGVAVSVGIIFAYYVLYNYLTILAKGDLLSPIISAFLPIGIGFLAGMILFWNKNR
ncbi:MAG: LptF/LptG family permease [Candidatus Caldarchaeum sp.]